MSALWERWHKWQEQSVNRRILAAAITVGLATCLVKLAVTGKDIVIAHRFGTSDSLDAFFIALVLPLFAVNVVGNSFNAALIPTFIEVRERDSQEAAQRLFVSIMLWSVTLLAGTCVLLGLLFPWIAPFLGSSFSPEKLALTRSLFYVLLPIVLLTGVATTWAGVLNAENRFALGGIAPVITPVAVVVALLTVGGMASIHALAGAMAIGALLEMALLGRGLRSLGFPLAPRWHPMNAAMRQAMRQYVPMITGAFLMGSTIPVDNSMAAMLGPGRVSALNYGNKVVALILGIGATAIGTAVFPHFSRMIAAGDWGGVRHTLKTYVGLVLLTTVPLTVVLCSLSRPIVALLFERAAFTADDTRLVSQIQALYLLQVPPYIVGTLIVRLISSLKANQLLFWAAAMNVVVNISLNYLFMRWIGVAGIALSTAVVYLLSTSYLIYMLARRLPHGVSTGNAAGAHR